MTTYAASFPVPPYEGSEEEWVAWAEAIPTSRQMGIRCTDIARGRATLTLDRSAITLNPNGSVHGGYVAAVADQCMGVIATTTLAPGEMPATATMHVHFLRPAFAPLTFEGEVTGSGQRLKFVEVTVLDAEGRRCASCHGSMAVNRIDKFPLPG